MNSSIKGAVIACSALFVFLGIASAGEEKQKQSTKTVSEVLPPDLAQFVKRAGSDRKLDDNTKLQLRRLRGYNPDPEMVFDILKPKTRRIISGSRILARVDLPEGLKNTGKEPDALVLAGSVVHLPEVDIPFGGRLAIGDTVVGGTILNAGPGTLILTIPDAPGIDEIALEPGSALMNSGCARSCSRTCRAGDTACCWDCGTGECCSYCTCVPAGTSCPYGSGGGSSCSVSCGQKH